MFLDISYTSRQLQPLLSMELVAIVSEEAHCSAASSPLYVMGHLLVRSSIALATARSFC